MLFTQYQTICLPFRMGEAKGGLSCAQFGNNLTQASPEFGSLSRGTFAIVNAPHNCSGNATKWNICYYSATTDQSSTTYLGVYRSLPGTTYRLVSRSLTPFMYTTPQNAPPYACSRVDIPQSQQYMVHPGDILVACVMSRNNGKLGIVGSVSGASVVQINNQCSSLPSDLPTSSSFTPTPDITVHINIGM